MADPQAVARIVARLTEPIPEPYQPPPRPCSKRWGLEPGRQLTHLATGLTYTVTRCDSEGVDLEPPARIESADWRSEWSPVRRPSTRPKKVKGEDQKVVDSSTATH